MGKKKKGKEAVKTKIGIGEVGSIVAVGKTGIHLDPGINNLLVVPQIRWEIEKFRVKLNAKLLELVTAEVHPVQGPGLIKICLVTVESMRRNEDELVGAEFHFSGVVFNVAFPAKRIKKNVIIATLSSFAVVKTGFGIIADVGDVQRVKKGGFPDEFVQHRQRDGDLLFANKAISFFGKRHGGFSLLVHKFSIDTE